MVHAPIRMTLGRAAGAAIAHTGSPALAWSAAAVLLAATIAVGALLNAVVEVPARRWLLRRISDPLAGPERIRRAPLERARMSEAACRRDACLERGKSL
jgi:peptidoglycan/LPS O-acetylase OafA/YrhL